MKLIECPKAPIQVVLNSLEMKTLRRRDTSLEFPISVAQKFASDTPLVLASKADQSSTTLASWLCPVQTPLPYTYISPRLLRIQITLPHILHCTLWVYCHVLTSLRNWTGYGASITRLAKTDQGHAQLFHRLSFWNEGRPHPDSLTSTKRSQTTKGSGRKD